MAKYKNTTTKFKADKAVGTGATRLKFDNNPSIWPTDEAKSTEKNIDQGIFSKEALGSAIGPSADYTAKSKKGNYMEQCFDHIMPNTISPTDKY